MLARETAHLIINMFAANPPAMAAISDTSMPNHISPVRHSSEPSMMRPPDRISSWHAQVSRSIIVCKKLIRKGNITHEGNIQL